MIKNKDGIGSRFLREPGIGYARTYGNFQAGLPRVEEVPGAKQAGAAIGRKLIGAGTVGTVREGGKICLIKKMASAVKAIHPLAAEKSGQFI